ncbi:FadR family transcriptional regulator, partial [bacterium]|nr:FadR family transcriptional regulator [bacterium]
MLEPIGRKSLSDSVYEQILARIVEGGIEPGEALPSERALCEMLQVNRGALREA